MRMILLYILFALLSQQTTDNGQQIESPSHQASKSPSKDNQNNSVIYYESQIHLADSLYKNYLPQYNFDEVKAAVMFFEKSSSHQVSKSPSRDNQNNSVTWRLSDSVTYYESQLHLADSLYKNYLPQYNFEEVKAAVTFFERTSGLQELRTSGTQELRNPEIQKSGDPEILSACAKAHYYHAVGLSERDDVVGACEHYLRALEIMEEYWDSGLQDFRTSGSQKSRDPEIQNPEIRFLALIYNRLGRLFYNENYCDLAIIKYRKALKYVEMIDEKSFKANVLKELGNSYQLANKPDSALYYYNESLRYNSSLPNKLDVEKSIAQILFYKGERDSAYSLIRDNLDNITDYTSRYSYYLTMGEMHFEDKQYDSAIKYLDLAMLAFNEHTLLSSSNKLSAIYDIIGDKDRKYYYDSISLSILNKKYNKSIDASKLQDVYRDYLDKKQEMERTKERAAYKNKIINFIMIILFVIIVSFILIVVLRYRHRMDRKYYIDRLSEKDSKIEEKQDELEMRIKENKNLNAELENIKNTSSAITKENIIDYYNCDTCKRILSEVERTENEKLKINNITCLSNEELISLEMNANLYLNGYIKNIQTKYPELKKQDIYCICLSLLNLNEPTIAVFLGKSYNAIWTRMKKIRLTMNINSNSELMHI